MAGTYFETEILMDPETNFCEVSSTFTYGLAVISEPRMGKPGARGTDRARQNRMSKTRPGHNMPRSGATLEFDQYLPGAMVDTASGSLVADAHHLLNVGALGGGNLAEVGGAAGATATATSLPNATGTRVRGGIVRVGAQLDGAALGQATVTGNPDTSLLVGLPAAPGATDVVRAAMMAYLDTDATPGSFRFLVGFREDEMQYAFHGCVELPPVFRIEVGGLPVVTRRFMCAYWRELPTAIPTSTTLQDCDPATTSGGSFVLNPLGTATRPDPNPWDLISTIEIAFNGTLIPVMGQGGRMGHLQSHVGYRRSKSSPEDPIATMRIVFPNTDDLLDYFDAGDGSDAQHFHFLATLSAGDGAAGGEGRHVAMYMPDIYLLERPTDANENQLPYNSALFALRDGPDTTNVLTSSAFRMGRS